MRRADKCRACKGPGDLRRLSISQRGGGRVNINVVSQKDGNDRLVLFGRRDELIGFSRWLIWTFGLDADNAPVVAYYKNAARNAWIINGRLRGAECAAMN